jgi:murein tripeptide amidase MpaA
MHREVLFHSFEGREMELITLTSNKRKTSKREEGFSEDCLLPKKGLRPYKFNNKPVIFLTSRVHPGETPASHVLNGILNFLTGKNTEADQCVQAKALMDEFVFKIIPMLNPDGVYRGYYRFDCKA